MSDIKSPCPVPREPARLTAGLLLRQLGPPLAVLILCIVLGRLAGTYWTRIQDQVAGSGPAGVAGFLLAFVLLTAACFPVSVLAVSAGALFGPWAGVGLIFPGGLLSGAFMYWLGKGLFHRRIQRLIAGHPKLAAVDGLAVKHAVRLNLLTRLSPLNFGLASYTLAVGRSGFRPYLLGLVGTLPSTVVWVLVGALAEPGRGHRQGGWSTGPTILLVLGLVFFVVLSWQVGRLVRRAWLAPEDGPS